MRSLLMTIFLVVAAASSAQPPVVYTRFLGSPAEHDAIFSGLATLDSSVLVSAEWESTFYMTELDSMGFPLQSTPIGWSFYDIIQYDQSYFCTISINDSVERRSMDGLALLWSLNPLLYNGIDITTLLGERKLVMVGMTAEFPLPSDIRVAFYDFDGNFLNDWIMNRDGNQIPWELFAHPLGAAVQWTDVLQTPGEFRIAMVSTDGELFDSLYYQHPDPEGSPYVQPSFYLRDGGYLAVYYGGDPSMNTIRFDSEMNIIWAKGMDDFPDYGPVWQWNSLSSIPTRDGGFIAAAATPDGPGIYPNPGLMRLDAQGNELWHWIWEMSSTPYTAGIEVTTVLQLADGSYFLGGTGTRGVNLDTDIFMARLAADVTPLEVHASPFNGQDTVHVAPGGQFRVNASVRNNQDTPATVDIWIQARLADGSLSGPFRQWENVTLQPGQTIEAALWQHVPPSAAPGDYNYLVRIGDEFPAHRFEAWFPIVIAGPRFQHHPGDPWLNESFDTTDWPLTLNRRTRN